ncbi:MAG: energy-coupling factor transporter transmembrane component T [Bacilli bacterium]|nr:energy-coupling factor transporter transmembrane component T [Bacilli bacterium]
MCIVVLGSYVNIKSDIHSLNTFFKLIDLILFVLIIIIVKNPYLLTMSLCFEFLLLLTSNIPFLKFLKLIFSLNVFVFFVVAINYLSGVQWDRIILTVVQIYAILLYSNLVIFTSTTNSIMKALKKIFLPLKIVGINASIMALIISLSLSFIPMLLKQGRRILYVLKSRGFDNGIYSLKLLIFPLFLMTLKNADSISDTMALKNFDLDNDLGSKEEYNYLDILLFFIHILLFVIILLEVLL